MPIAIATIFAASCFQSWASDAPDAATGSWTYQGYDVFLSVNLAPNGNV